MAEYVEVIRIGERICKSFIGNGGIPKKCHCCQLSSINNGKNITCTELRRYYPEEYERICLEWAKEHPVQTNEDKFEEVFGFKPKHECLNPISCGECAQVGNFNCIRDWWNEEYKAPTDKNSILEDLKPRGSADMPKDIVCNCTEEQK